MSETEKAIERVRKQLLGHPKLWSPKIMDVGRLHAEHGRLKSDNARLVRERDALAAANESAPHTAECIAVRHINPNGATCICWKQHLPSAILAARDAAEQVKGAVKGINEAIYDPEMGTYAHRKLRIIREKIRSGELPLPPDAPGESEDGVR